MELSALEQIRVLYSEPKRKNKKRTFCKKCGGTDHVRSTKFKCPMHPNYTQINRLTKKRGRPFGSKRAHCKVCGPMARDHINSTKKKCPNHPEYKAPKKRTISNYHLFIKKYFSIQKRAGKDLDFQNTMKMARIIWKTNKKMKVIAKI